MKGWRHVSIPLALGATVFLIGACAQTNLAIHTLKRIGQEVEQTKQAASRERARARALQSVKIGEPYQVAGVWYYPKSEPGYNQTGIASWYGGKFHGRKTANGETFDMNALTAAHKTLPMPSRVRVTNLQNGRSLVLRVNDRGPFTHGRIIDLSRRAAQLLGFERQGTARVRVAMANTGQERFVPKPVTPDSERRAVAAAPLQAISAEPLPAPPGMVEAAAPPSSAPRARRITSSLSPPDPMPAEAPERVTTLPVQPTLLYVQAGAFSFVDNARRLSRALKRIGRTQISVVRVGGRDYYRVRIGPLRDLPTADTMLAQVIESGYPGARIVVD